MFRPFWVGSLTTFWGDLGGLVAINCLDLCGDKDEFVESFLLGIEKICVCFCSSFQMRIRVHKGMDIH